MFTVLLVVQVLIAIALIAFVLLQKSDSDGFGLGSSSGGGGGLMSGRAKSNFMTKTTAMLAAAFMLNSILLGVISSSESGNSIAERIAESQKEQKELSAPLADTGGKKAVDEKKLEDEIPESSSEKIQNPISVPLADEK